MPILITGATGNIGRELVRILDAQAAPTRVLVRDPTRAADLPPSAERVIGDLDDPATLAPAFRGVDTVFLLTQGTGTDQAEHALAAARSNGVGRIVHLSSFHAAMDPAPPMARWHQQRERLVRATGIPATFVRPGGFMTNSFAWLPTLRAGDFVLDVLGPGRVASIDPVDIAAVAALALTEDGHTGQAYALTGEQALTTAEQVGILADALGRPIEIRTANTPEEAVRARWPEGAPPALAESFRQTVLAMRADTEGVHTDTVRRLLGRAPHTFAQWCQRNIAAFRTARPEG